MLNYTREDYGAEIVAEDDRYTTGGLEKAMGLRPTIAEDGTEVYPEVIGCSIHTTAGPVIDIPIVIDPDDPQSSVTEEGDINFPAEPETPVTPDIPVEPVEPSGGQGTEEWWGDFWGETPAE